MASDAEIEEPGRRRRGLRIGCLASLALALILLAAFLIVWANRKDIADNIIAAELESRGIPATYEIEKIAGQHQVLRNIVIGNPASPDLTIERAEVILRYGFGLPSIAELRLTGPRLHGTYLDGELSFGALDPLVFTGAEGPFQLPDMRLQVADGRALIESDHGPLGISLTGDGWLRGGFEGELGVTAPLLTAGVCELRGATLYGTVSVDNAHPGFAGPLRIAALNCPEQELALDGAAVRIDARVNEALERFEGEASLRAGAVRLGASAMEGLGGESRFTWRDGGLTASYALEGTGLDTAGVAIARLGAEGTLRTQRQFERIELDSELDGRGVRLGGAVDSALASAQESTEGTLLRPLLTRMRSALAAETRASRLAADVTLRRSGTSVALVMPRASLRGGSGSALLTLSRVQGALEAGKAPRLSGSFASGGANLPRIAGRMEQRPDGGLRARLNMAEYAAGMSRLAIPELAVVWNADGAMGFSGEARASGELPGGFAENLAVPLSGNWSGVRGLSLWRGCTDLRFDALRFASLTLDSHELTLCPPRGGAIVRHGAGGLRVAAGTPSLQLSGSFGETPITIRSGAVGLAWPGALSARELEVTLGPAETATRFALADLLAQIGEDIAGRFSGADVRLYAVPLDLLGANGAWRYADGRLALSDGAFTLLDRQSPARFEPLAAEGATLALEDNRIVADATLREPLTGREVTEVDLVHDLSSGRGHADLAVRGLTFDTLLQPETLTQLAFGIVAEVRGTVTGTGRIDWNETAVTSRGRFSSESLDLAAAFGPVKGASGTVEFSDLLGLTTAPGQRLRIQSVNPGVEVLDGTVAFQLRNGEVLALEGGTWPFMGGTLTMRPVAITFGAAEVRRYIFEIEGLDAARFIERMELGNISATGTFDGTVPVVFDAQGFGHLEDGILLSRPPGGNVSYVGELTYEDLGTMANLAFDALRSLDYRQMRVEMNGDLAGEIITSVRMDGVSQGVGAQRNILTRAVAGLPIRLDVNIRAQFYTLLSNLRSLYDPAAVRDPRSVEVGLLDAQGNRIRRDANGNPLSAPPESPVPESPTPDENLIQRRESEENP
jgi:hypothetical protein